MSRPKSPITGVPTTTVYLRPEDRITFRRMGGATWLRQVLDQAPGLYRVDHIPRPATGVWTSVRLSPVHKERFLARGGVNWFRGLLRLNGRGAKADAIRTIKEANMRERGAR